MKRLLILGAAGGALVAVGCSEQTTGPATQRAPSVVMSELKSELNPGARFHHMGRRADYEADRARQAAGGGGGSQAILYHGGPVILQPKIVAIYWGNAAIYQGGPAPNTTGSGTQDGSLVGAFLGSLGGSAYWNINTTYTNGSGAHVQNILTYTGFWATNHSAPASGSKPTDAAMESLINYGFTNGFITYDANTIYAIFTASGVNLGGGFGTQYCAYHGHFSSSVGDVKYSANPYDYQFPSACSALSGSPNGDPAADAEVNTLAHETEEFTTDPDLNAWYDRRGNENADKCAWTFGATYRTANGATANMRINGRDYLVQQNWVQSTSRCAKSYP